MSTTELWFFKEQYECEMIPVMYGPIDTASRMHTFWLLGHGDEIYGMTVGVRWITQLQKVTAKRAQQMIILWDKQRPNTNPLEREYR
jgi:hypothetical protein